MKRSRRVRKEGPPIKIELFTEKDAPEYERITRELAKVLKKLGGYEPAVDDLYIDEIARAVIYEKKIEIFLDADTATDYTYSRVTDSKVKLSKTIENAMRQLAINRRDRLAGQTQAGLMKELREAILRGLKSAGQ